MSWGVLFILSSIHDRQVLADDGYRASHDKKVLILNSYHKGYKWSDDIEKGIEDQLQGPFFDIRTEYMDAKRIVDPAYPAQLAEIYRYKFSQTRFDLILTTDDAAFNFVKQYHEILFKEAYVMACGLNYFDPESDLWSPRLRAVVPEVYDIKGTIDAALMIHPETDTIYVINDTTPTGQLIQQAFDAVQSRFEGRIRFISLAGAPMKTIQETLEKAPDRALGLLLVYFRGEDGRYYQPEQAAQAITDHARIPVYGVWDFYMNHGIIGGVLTRGYGQGEVLGEVARSFLLNEPKENDETENDRDAGMFDMNEKSGNALCFDYNLLKRFNVPLYQLPRKSTILNMKYADQKNILILNSYDEQLKWTRDVVAGMNAVFDEIPYRKRVYVEYMDTKNFPLPETYSHLLALYKYKYANIQLDLILTSDDNAFQFVLKNRAYLFQGVPLVFCGVNFLEDEMLQDERESVTGIVESIDIRGTVQLMRDLHPEVEKIVVINDQSATGLANKRRVMDELPPHITNRIAIEFTPSMKMTDLQRALERENRNTLILLMTFNRDQNNDTFSYKESISLISGFAKNPIYGLWDFYLGDGIVGGMLTSGRGQGVAAARMGVEILAGRSPGKIPIIRESDAVPMFDGRYLKRFDISENRVPEGSRIINRSSYFQDNHWTLFIVGGMVLIALAVCTIVLFFRMRSQQKIQKVLEIEANIDPLTQLFNRAAGMRALSDMIERCNRSKTKMVLCFVDIDRLKFVNDTLGHTEGDRYIRLVARSIEGSIRVGQDVSARIGGDEFLLLLYNHGLDSAEIIIQRIKKRLAQKDGSGQYPYPVGASFGMAVYNASTPCSIDVLIDRADAEMYRNKEARRAMER